MAEEEVDLDDESQAIDDRLHAFVNLGFNEATALILAWDHTVSISGTRELLRKGCPLDTAALIVLENLD